MKNVPPKRKKDPRTQNGAKRKQLRARLKAQGRPCHICGLPIDYSLSWYIDPKDGKKKRHPLSFEVDELKPTAQVLKEEGYEAAVRNALDIDCVAPAHRICNQKRGAATRAQLQNTKINKSVSSAIPHYLDL